MPRHTHTFNQDNVFNLLFLGNERYKDRGTHCIVFAWRPAGELVDQAVTAGSFARELIYLGGSVSYRSNDLLYCGPNPFLNIFETESPLV